MIISNTTTGYTLAQFRADLQNGIVADSAQRFVGFGLNNHPTLASPNNVPFVKFYQNPNIGQIELFTNAGSYNYNSLQVEIRRRFSQGLYFQANYTFSKNLTDTVRNKSSIFLSLICKIKIPNSINSVLTLIRRIPLILTVFINLPFGKGKMFLNQGGIIDKIFGGFELSGLRAVTSTGSPISFIDRSRNIKSRSAFGKTNSDQSSDK